MSTIQSTFVVNYSLQNCVKIKAKFSALILAIITATTSHSAPSSPSSESGERNQDIAITSLRPVLKATKKACRIYYAERCETNGGFVLPFPKLKVQSSSEHDQGLVGLREIFQSDREVNVVEETEGIVRVNIGKVSAAVLQTKIPLLTLNERERYTPQLAIWAIKHTKEFENAKRRLGLEEPPTVYSVALQEPTKGLPHLPAIMRNVTVDQALDAVAKTFGAVIVFGECTSTASGSFFIVKIVFL